MIGYGPAMNRVWKARPLKTKEIVWVNDTAQSRGSTSNFETTLHTDSSHTRRGVHIGYHLATLKPVSAFVVTRPDASRNQSSTACFAGMYPLWPAQDEGRHVLILHILGTALTVLSYSVMARFLRAINV
jgi:hypothetical protein